MKKILLILMIVSAVMGQANHTGWPLELLSWNVDKAYPGIEYNYRLGVKGGEYPYTFALRHGPTGMVVDSTGALIWTPASATTDSVRVVVKDQLNDSLVVEYGITATTTGFYFVDSATGSNSNAGTEAAPWLTMAYASATADSSSYVYVRSGKYSESEFTIEATYCGRFMAYPGETVVVNSISTGDATIWINGGNKRLFQGFTFNGNDRRWFFSVGSTGYTKNVIWRNNTIHNVGDGGSGNPAGMFFWDAGGNPVTGGDGYDKIVVQDNIFYDLNGSSMVCFDVKNLLFENNTVHDIQAGPGNGISDKNSGYMNTFRGNLIYNCPNGIVLMTQVGQSDIEVCYNHIYGITDLAPIIVGMQGGNINDVFIHHNTLRGNIKLHGYNVIDREASNNINIYKNIIGKGLVHPYLVTGVNDNWPANFFSKVSVDSNIVYGLSNATNVAGYGYGIPNLSWTQWRDSGQDLNSLYMQLTYDSDSIPILSDSLLNIYGHLANGFTYTAPDPELPVIPTFIQSHDTTNDGPSSSMSVRLDTPAVAGNTLIAIVSNYSAHTSHSVSDSLNNNWQLVDSMWSANALSKFSVWIATNCKAGITRLDATYGSVTGVSYRRIAIMEYSGIDSIDPIAAHLSFGGAMPSAGVDAITTNTLTPARSNSLLFATCREGNYNSNNNLSAGTNFTLRFKTSADYHMVAEDRIHNGTDPVAATFTVGTTQSGGLVGVYAIFNPLGSYVPDPEPPVITVQPRDTTVTDGSVATFTISATNATGYQWYGNGSLISGATNSTYSFTGTLALSGSSIYCMVYNATDTINSDTVTLTVNIAPKTPATITQQPVSDTVTAGQSATFFVTASGSGLVYQWFRNDSLLAGATNDTFTYTSRTGLSYVDNVYCALTTDTTVNSDTVTLTVISIPLPVLSQSTDTLKLHAKHTGTTQWLQNGSVIGSGSSISLNADSAFYAGTKIEAVTGSNKSTWQFKSSGGKRSINFK